jgi:hypothetical protein
MGFNKPKPRPNVIIGPVGGSGTEGPTMAEALSMVSGLGPPARIPTYAESINTLPAIYAGTPDRAPDPQAVLDRRGYLPQQRSGNYDAKNSLLAYNKIDPRGQEYYRLSPAQRLQTAREMLMGRDRLIDQDEGHPSASEDAWAMYLGLPQTHKSFEVSPYRPSKSSNPNQLYLRLPSLWEALEVGKLKHRGEKDAAWQQQTDAEPGPISATGIQRILNYLGEKDRRVVAGDVLPTLWRTGAREPGFALADFTISRGQDEHGPYISVYDIWDLDAPGAGTRIGRNFEIYDRVYYDPETLNPLEPQPSAPVRR